MQIIREVKQLQGLRYIPGREITLGLVPTMGALHEGHARLIQMSVEQNTYTVVSIFVNPTQFGPGEDYKQYPRTWESDLQLLEDLHVDAVFSPDIKDIYPPEPYIGFTIRNLNDRLEGISRPGHMEGVLQIVSILFNLVQPDRAYFGLKDYQQYLLVSRLVQELHTPVEIVSCPIARECDGLAMSSRNVYLSYEERRQAVALYEVLCAVKEKAQVVREPVVLKKYAQEQLNQYPLVRLDYFEILNGNTLEEINILTTDNAPHAFIAAYLGHTRLIDNMALSQQILF